MSSHSSTNTKGALFISVAVLLTLAFAAPVEQEEESVANELSGGYGVDADALWDSLDADALRKLLMQIQADDRTVYAPRATRAWSPLLRGYAAPGPRAFDTRAVRQWRADKRQVRFRQCYFNPISCFRK